MVHGHGYHGTKFSILEHTLIYCHALCAKVYSCTVYSHTKFSTIRRIPGYMYPA
jgi:hypothetical protein